MSKEHDELDWCPFGMSGVARCEADKALKAENAKLREQVTQLQSEWESERDYADQMEAKEKMAVAENDKLRELLSQALAARELKTFFEYFEPHSFWAGWCEDVHKMGIEVGNG